LRIDKEIRLKIDLLEGKSRTIAKMLAKAMRQRNEAAFKEYAERLATNRGRVEELLWVLGEKPGQSVLDLQVAAKNNNSLSVKEVIERLKAGEMKMDNLSLEVQAMVRKSAFEMKNVSEADY
jgi:hypothetical protein